MIMTIKDFDLTKVVASLDTLVKATNAEKRALEDAARAKQQEADKARETLWYFIEVAKMAGWAKSPERSREYWQWYAGQMNGAQSGNKTAWSQYHYFRMVGYEFTVDIMERSDLKRDKYVVKVNGSKYTPSAGNHSVSSYNDYDYVKKTYGKERELEMKFRTLEDAEKCAQEWKDLFFRDHVEEIEKQLDMIASITPEQIKYAQERRYI